MKIFKSQSKIISRLSLVLLTGLLVVAGSLWQASVLKVNANVQVLLVSDAAIPFGNVFPGENDSHTYTVQLDTSSSGATYLTTMDPLPNLQNLCPFLDLKNIDSPAEPDTLPHSTLSRPNDILDKWQVSLKVPGIKGQLSQDHNGGIIVQGGDFGCKITITTDSAPTTFHFVKVLCPAYSDIAGNAQADNYDATGGNFSKFTNYSSSSPHFPSPYPFKPVNPNEIPPQCTRIPGWQFKLSTDSGQSQNVTLTGLTDNNGQTDLPISSLSSAQQNALTSGGMLWVSEVPQPDIASFGVLRCYNDAVNGDNLEIVQPAPRQTLPGDVTCIAYNVPKPKNITIDGYKVICDQEKDLPDWGTPTTPGRPAQMTQAVINKFVADSKGECKFVKDWQFQFASPGTPNKAGNFVGAAGGAWQSFNSSTGGSSSTPASLALNAGSAPGYLWVREVLKSGYIPFTDGDGSVPKPKDKSAELFCNTDGLNYDNYDRVDGPLVAGITYTCVAFNVKGSNDKKDEEDNDYKHEHQNYSTMSDYKHGIKNKNQGNN